MKLIVKEAPEDIKYRKKKLILYCIQHFSPISRAEISQKLKISKPTVSYIVEELIAEDWVHESNVEPCYNKVGKKPIHLTFNSQAGYVIGVDIGGTNVLVAISDVSGNIITTRSFKTTDSLKSGLLEKLKITIEELINRSGIPSKKILGMGIGVPGITDVETGYVVDAPALGLKNFPLKEKIEQIIDVPVYIDNDVNVSVLGEHWIGAAQNTDNVLLISIGTGVGSGLLVNGKLFRGNTCGAGEIGYMITDKSEAKKRELAPFDGYGFLDAQVGGGAIRQKMLGALKKVEDHPLHSKGETLTTKDVFEFAIDQDPLSLKVVTEAIEHLSFAIINAVVLLNPETIILGGGISKSGHWFLENVRETVSSYVPFNTKIELTSLGEKMGVVGAISLFLREHESVLKQ